MTGVRLKLTARYALIMTGTILAVVIVFALLFSSMLRSTGDDLRMQSTEALRDGLAEQIQLRGSEIADMLAEYLVNPLYALDMQTMHRMIKETSLLDGVEFVAVIDENRRIVHDGTISIDSYGELVDALVAVAEDSPNIRIERPIMLSSQPLGSIVVDMAITPALQQSAIIDQELSGLLERRLQGASQRIMGYAAAALLIGLLLAVAIARHFAQPILALAEYARGVGQGRRDQPPARERGDEIGMLAESLGQMSIDLSQSSGEATYLAYHDSLTGLPNRAQLKRSLAQEIDHAVGAGSTLALLFLDLDDFKRVNDTLGHEAGDELLVAVGERFKAVAEAWNDNNVSWATVSRLGGDEFTVTITNIIAGNSAKAMAELLIESLETPIVIEERSFLIGTSIGITICPSDSDELDTMLRYADRAMYRAKQQGRNTYRFFERSRDGTATRESSLETDLDQALDTDGLAIHYQPIIDPVSGEVIAVEALARWHHAVLGYVQPSRFVQLAEQTGRIERLDQFVITRLMDDILHLDAAGFPRIQVAANVASLHLRNSSLIEHIEQQLVERSIDGSLLRIEVREKTIMRHLEFAATNARALRDLGVDVWIDNFGTRIATLKHIDMLPVSGIKIDNEFIDGISQGNNHRIVTQAITDMCHNMQLPVIAEGVEHLEQLEFLRQIGCDYAQGYLFARPMPLNELMGYLNKHRKKDDGQVIALRDHLK